MQPDATQPKPAHLGPRYGAQFDDVAIAAAYYARPPYPREFFSILNDLHAPGPRRVLELGCGTGDVTIGLVAQADHIDAVEPSAKMLTIARRRVQPDAKHLQWIHAPAEAATLQGPYSLAVAAECLHWMEWSIVLPKIAAALAPGAFLVLAERGDVGHTPWGAELAQLIPKYSTNQDFHPYDLVNELTTRGLFREIGRCNTAPVTFSQSIDDHIESMHSRNGFSRQRMSEKSAREFDESYTRLLQRDCPDGIVHLQTTVKLIWGYPTSGLSV